MSIWKPNDVDKTPSIVMTNWKVFEVTSPYWDGSSRHFVGYNQTESEGRVSSEIQSFDPESMRGWTRSGRIYQLSGRPGTDEDAEYVWQKWLHINDIISFNDVTKEYISNE